MVLDFSPTSHTPSRFASSAPAAGADSSTDAMPGQQTQFCFGASPSKRPLPPTRAAHRTRSRGIFLELATAAKLIAVIGAVAVLTSAFPGIGRVLTSMNPGPALVAATAVPPTFVLPKHLR